jgi:hypothetical protein
MAENTPKLAYLLDPLFQIENVNGKPLVGGYIEVYYAGTNEKYITYQNFDFTQNPFKIPLGSDGRAVVLAQTEQAYDVYVRDSFGNLVFSRLNIAPGGAGGVAFGMTKVTHDDTLTGNGTQLSPLGVSPLTNLAVDETMTAYEATVEGKESLVLGVNGDWFNSAISGISNDFVTNEKFSACCSAVKGGLDNKVDLSALNNYYTKTETWNTFLPRSGLDLSNYYTTAQTYNKYEIEDRLDGKQDRLTFGYDENSAISSINNSALAGGQGGGDTTPWISGAKILADTQTLTDNMIVQVLSSFTLSGNKNHCIAVKGGTYRFPNKWEIASGIAETNYFMPQSSMSGYLPTSSFTSYTASIASNLENNWNYTNSAYSLSINNFYNKLDASAFSAWSATYSGNSEVNNYITNNSSFIDDSVNVVQTNSGKWNEIEVYEQNSGTYLTAHQDISNKLDTTAFSTVSGTFLTAHQDLSYISGKIDDKLDTTALENLSGEFYPMTGNPSGFLTAHQDLSNYATTSVVNNISSYLSGEIENKLDKSESGNFYPMTGNPSGFLTEHQSLNDYYKKTETSSKEEISAAIASIPLGDEEVNNVVHTNSGVWNNKLDATAYHELTAGANIDIQNYVISSKDWTNEIREASANAFNEATAQIPSPFDPTYLSGQIDNKLNKSESANFYPMTGNPSGFLTAHQSLEDYYKKTETSSREEISAAINELSGKLPDIESVYTLTGGTGVEIDTDHVNQRTIINVTGQFDNTAVNNVVQNYSANGTWLTAHQSLTNYYTKNETSSKQEISTALQYISSNAGKTYTGDDPIYVNNETNHIGITGETLSAGPNIDIFASGGYVVISAANGGGQGAIYNGISPIDVNNTTHQISAKGVSFGVQEPLFFVQDDNQAVIIGCSAGGGTTYTGDAQGALDEVYANSGVWLTAHQDISNLLPKSESANYYPMKGNPSGFLTAHQSLSNYVSKNDTSVKIGFQNTATDSFAQGENCSATNWSFAQGSNNSAGNDSFAQGVYNKSTDYYSFAQGGYNQATGMYSFAQGYYNSAASQSFAQGFRSSAYDTSFAQGASNTAYNESIAQGRDNYASNKSQAFGKGTKATNSGMAIGTYNKTESAAFVVGNGTWNNKSDAFIINHDGSVSAAGKISANGVELGAIPYNIVYTASLPATPDTNTLYLIPEA